MQFSVHCLLTFANIVKEIFNSIGCSFVGIVSVDLKNAANVSFDVLQSRHSYNYLITFFTAHSIKF